jgi:hypothetical protein
LKKSRRLSIGQQIFAVRSFFHQFQYYRSAKGPTLKGWLQPTDESPKYTILLRYRIGNYPSVRVVNPRIDPNAPHRYSDGSLCLYYPKDESWKSDMFLAKTVIPWTAEWLRFYEIWLMTGEWYGPEAPHSGRKVKP